MADLDDLLEKTSRTFALSIPLLPEPTRREVTVAYLLFRIADTFEDAVAWPRERQIEALSAFQSLLGAEHAPALRRAAPEWLEAPPVDHPGYLELLAETPFVVGHFWDLGEQARDILRRHLVRTAEGMSRVVARKDPDGWLDLGSLEELRAYCYIVAGIVGEMLTELFLLDRPLLASVAGYLRDRSRLFGEGLQLVNILKDSDSDVSEGRSFLPRSIDRHEVFELARRDLVTATEYTLALQRAGAPRGVVATNAFQLLLAWSSLDRIEREGPGSKVSRPEVYRLLEQMNQALDRGEPAVPTLPREVLDRALAAAPPSPADPRREESRP